MLRSAVKTPICQIVPVSRVYGGRRSVLIIEKGGVVHG